MKQLFILLFLALGMSSYAQKLSQYDINAPFGWANCTSLTQGDAYKVTGGADKKVTGEGGKQITLVSDGKDMRQRIMDAIRDYDIIILDGKGGDFIVSSTMRMKDISNRTIVGINGARVCTQFYCSPEIHKMLNDAEVKQFRSVGDGTAFTLSNGHKVREPREYKIRQTLIDHNNDQKESFRESGLFNMSGFENIIIRNLILVGPGAIDVGGDDLMTATHNTKHIWIDHCEFIDGMDGNFDINSKSDFITISWCIFRYTERTFIHAYTNLIGANDNAQFNGEDNLNVTYANCIWDKGCDQRMPMVRFGTIHLLNCLYDCANNAAAINPRRNSEVFIDRCYFGKGVKNIFRQTDAKAYQFNENIYTEKFEQPADYNKVFIPYKYTGMKAKLLPSVLRASNGAGATLTDPLKIN